MAVIDCTTCGGAGIYAGNGETCQRCLGWGHLKVTVEGPFGQGKVQTEDIETVYARLEEAQAVEDAEVRARGFEDWDASEGIDRARERLRRRWADLVPEWTLS